MKKKYKHIIWWSISIILWILIGYVFIKLSQLRLHSWSDIHEAACYLIISGAIICLYFLITKKQFTLAKYIFIIIGTTLVISFAEFLILKQPFFKIFNDNHFNEEAIRYSYKWNFISILVRNFAIVSTATVIFFFRKMALLAKEKSKRLELEVLFEKAKYVALSRAINAHFMFNTLMLIEANIKRDANLASQNLRKLSEIYAYIVQMKDAQFVSISKDLKYMEAIVEIQRQRVFQDIVTITFQKNIYNETLLIPPMLFETFIDNAFKYVDKVCKGFIDIKIETDENNHLHFFCQNNYDPKYVQEKESGLQEGINFASDRIKFFFENDNESRITITNKNSIFTVEVFLNLNNKKS